MKVLLADNDAKLLHATASALRCEGFEVLTATNGRQTLQLWQRERPDVVVAEAHLPRLNGFEVCRRLRLNSGTSLILVTRHSDEEEALLAFRSGADDFVVKPYSTRVLALRIQAVARRLHRKLDVELPCELRIGDLVLDPLSQEVRHGERTVRLTRIEFHLLHLLARNAGQVVPSAQLVEHIWGYGVTDAVLLKTHVSRIRKKLRLPRGRPGDIASIPGVGYRLTVAEVALPRVLRTPRRVLAATAG